jgi:tetratricopeptide (TPR) repeat protein
MDATKVNERQRLLGTAQEARQSGKLDAAVAACAELLRGFPDDPSCLSLAAALAADQGDVERGMHLAGRALAADPALAEPHFTLGRLYEMQQRLVDAEASYGKALALDPSNARAHNNLGVVLQMQGKVPDALAAYRKAVELAPELPEANQNFASIIRDSEAMQRAVAGFRRRIVENPSDADSYNSLANGLRELGRHDEALEAYAKAIALQPDFAEARFNRAMVLLQVGDYERGWPEYEWRLKTATHSIPATRFSVPMWHGRETARTVLLHAEQGLGDTLQFARFAPLAAARCGAVVLECQPELRPLLLTMKGAPRVVARGDPLPVFEMHAPLMSLPALLGTTLATLPWDGPYLQAPHERVTAWRKAFSKRRAHFNVGLVWAGRPQHWDDFNRSIPLAKFAPLGRVPGAAFFSLQLGDPAAEAKAPPDGMAFFDLTEAIRDFADTAALISFLDLVITVDTSVAHLAGAMGVPTWVLLARAPDWRWHIGREDSPWYPSVRLFRQARDGDWSGAIDAAAADLERLARLKAG